VRLITDKTLPRLAEEFPEIWREVIASIKGHIERRQMDQLSDMAMKANATMARWMSAAESPLADTNHAQTEVIKAQMTRLAIEQFICAYTGVSTAVSFKDRFLIASLLWIAAERGIVTTQKRFDALWSMIANKTAAAAAIQKSGYWSIPTREICAKISNLAQGEPILEIGSGRGLYLAGLRAAGANAQGIDDCSWAGALKTLGPARKHITRTDAASALRDMSPKVVLCVWPTPQNTFESLIFKTKSVQTYLVILSKHRFASGDWNAYKAVEASGNFTCTTLPETNMTLRPLEMEQQILIFRRMR
jgi:hypothetical protein